jgi:hypothetical protein
VDFPEAMPPVNPTTINGIHPPCCHSIRHIVEQNVTDCNPAAELQQFRLNNR